MGEELGVQISYKKLLRLKFDKLRLETKEYYFKHTHVGESTLP